MPACLVCNLNEMGWGQLQDVQPITIVIPSWCLDEIPNPVAATKNILAQTSRDPQMEMRCQDVD
jgi:hypothetical protein